MSATEVLVALAIAFGIAGIIVPVLPGTLLVLGAILVWSVQVGTSTGWAVFTVATLLLRNPAGLQSSQFDADASARANACVPPPTMPG